MTGDVAGDITGMGPPGEPSPEQLRKEAAKLARRVSQLEATLTGVEQIRDTNARLLDRLRGELEVERARSQQLLLNVLPQAIIDRLNAGESLIADRYEDVAVVFSDFVGFTEISGRLPVADLVTALNGLFSAFDAACAALGVESAHGIIEDGVNLVAPGGTVYVDGGAANAPLTIRAVKGVVRELLRDEKDRDVDACDALVRQCFESEDYKEGRQAFLEKRKPVFTGK